MPEMDDEERRLRSVTLQNAQAVLVARQRAEQELIRAKAALQEQTEWLRVTLSSIGDAVIATDAEGRVTFMNGVAEALTGWTQAEAERRPLAEVFRLVNETTREPVESPALRVLAQGVIVGLANHTILIAKDGTERPIDDSAAPIRDGTGAVGGAVLVFRDITERKRAEDERERLHREVAAERERLAETFRMAPSFMCVLAGPDHVLERANDRYYQLVGHRVIVGKPIREALPEIEGQGLFELLDRVYRTGEAFAGTDMRVSLEPGGGRPPEVRYVDFVYQPMRDAGGSVTGILMHGIDLTERKRAERELRESESFLTRLLASSPDCIKVLDIDGRIQSMNEAGMKLMEFDDFGRVKCASWAEFWHGQERAAADRSVAEGRAGRSSGFVGFCPTFAGRPKWWDVVITPIPGAAGAVEKLLVVSRDITERKRDEEALRFLADASASLAELVDHESTLRRIANLAVSGFADWCVVDILDEGGSRRRLAVTNSESAEVAFARASDAAFRSGDDAIGGIPHVLRTGEPEVVSDLAELDPATAPLGAERIERLREWGVRSYLCVPLLSRGKVIGGMTFLGATGRHHYGATELRVAQELAQRVTTAIENAGLYRALQEQDRRKDEFLATLAHELRNPLAPVRNGLQILRLCQQDGDAFERTMGMMERQLGHMVHLIDDLMDVARVSSGKVVLRKERVELRAVVAGAVETSRQMIEGGGHELAIQLPDEPLAFDADRTRLAQVLSNLLNNAAKYTPQGGRIVVSAERDGHHAIVRVADTGVGIPAEMLPKIFDMFTQVGTSLDRSQGGLGIGLTLVKRLVEMHGGTVGARSAGAGKGSEFAVRLPLAAEDALQAGTESPSGAEEAGARLSILVVDDNEDAAESLAMLLGLKGHEVRTAHDGPQALRMLEVFRPHLVLLDLGLPGMSGYEVARRIRGSAELRGLTLAALTGWGQEEDRRRTKEAGFDHHLVKPVEPAALQALLDARGG